MISKLFVNAINLLNLNDDVLRINYLVILQKLSQQDSDFVAFLLFPVTTSPMMKMILQSMDFLAPTWEQVFVPANLGTVN